jgi:type IV pilus assembly protein PilM
MPDSRSEMKLDRFTVALNNLLVRLSSQVQTKKNSLGVLLDKQKLYCAHLSYTHKKIIINALSAIDLHENTPDSVKPLDILKQALPENSLKKALVVSGFPTLKTLARTIDIQSIKQKEMDAAITYQIEPHLPYPLTECALEKVLIDQQGKLNQYLVIAAQKTDIKEHLDELKALDIDPEIVSPKSQGLIQFAHVFIRENNPFVLIDICPSETTCILLFSGKPLAIRSLPFSLEGSINDNSQEASQLKALAREVSRVLLAFKNILPEDELPLVFTGPVEQDPLILSLLAKLLGHDALFAKKPPKNIFLPDDISLSDCFAYAAPIGLALLQSPLQKQNFFINFRKNEFLHPRPWLRWKKEFALYFTIMALSAATLFFIGKNLLQEGRKPLYENYLQIIALLEKTPLEIETAFALSTGKEPALGLQIDKLFSLSDEELEERLSFIEQKYTKPSEEIALHPNVPRVLDLLTWLQDHPKIKLSGPDAKLKLESLNYVMVKRPEKGKVSEKYQVRVDIEFTSNSPETAKEFQDAITTPNQFVNPSAEIRWQAQKNRYQTSFFLKDFTQYQKGSN